MHKNRLIQIIIVLTVIVLATIPLLSANRPEMFPWLGLNLIAAVNLCGWCLLLAHIFSRFDLHGQLTALATKMGLDIRLKPLEKALNALLSEIKRRNTAISTDLIEKRITTREELSQLLERIAFTGYKLLNAESAELALFNSDTGMYHSSIVVGKPFRTSAQAMLSGAASGEHEKVSPDVIIEPIAFAGTVLGSIRIGLKKGTLPTIGDQEIIRLLALQSSLALINVEYNRELLKMKKSSEESVRAKTGFLANLSHEIRGPLGIMLNAVELVLDGLCGPLSADQMETLNMVRGNGSHLLELINDVLDYAKVESGRIIPDPVIISVDDLLTDIRAVVRSQAESKSHQLTYRKTPEALAISCDRRHIRQMLINLLTNAIKYTPENGQIDIWAERLPGNKVKINVKDNGVGIEEAQRNKVFEAFERVENSYSINQMGTGLGMPLTSRLAEVNGGYVDFSSEPNQGSHFWLIFAAQEVSDQAKEKETEGQTKTAVKGEGHRILLAEGEQAEGTMLSRYLSNIGFSVQTVNDIQTTINLLRSESFELLIVDDNLASNPQHDIVAEIRAKTAKAFLPLILISSHAFVFDVEKFLRSGADRCLAKPVELADLAVTCRQLIDANCAKSVKNDQRNNAEKKEGPLKVAPSRIVRTGDFLH